MIIMVTEKNETLQLRKQLDGITIHIVATIIVIIISIIIIII